MRNFSTSEEKDYKQKILGVGKYENETQTAAQYRFLEKTALRSKFIAKRLLDAPEEAMVLLNCWASSVRDVNKVS